MPTPLHAPTGWPFDSLSHPPALCSHSFHGLCIWPELRFTLNHSHAPWACLIYFSNCLHAGLALSTSRIACMQVSEFECDGGSIGCVQVRSISDVLFAMCGEFALKLVI